MRSNYVTAGCLALMCVAGIAQAQTGSSGGGSPGGASPGGGAPSGARGTPPPSSSSRAPAVRPGESGQPRNPSGPDSPQPGGLNQPRTDLPPSAVRPDQLDGRANPDDPKRQPLSGSGGGSRRKQGQDLRGAACRQAWDPSTHMSREDWAAACQRVDKRDDQLEGRR